MSCLPYSPYSRSYCAVSFLLRAVFAHARGFPSPFSFVGLPLFLTFSVHRDAATATKSPIESHGNALVINAAIYYTPLCTSPPRSKTIIAERTLYLMKIVYTIPHTKSIDGLQFSSDSKEPLNHATFPVDGVVANLGKTTRAAVDTEVNVGKMLVVCDFRTLLDTNIARISLDSCVSLLFHGSTAIRFS